MDTESVAGLMLRDAYLVVPEQVWRHCFFGAESAAVRVSGRCLEVFPVHDVVQGGRLFKQRNLRGDRVLQVGDLLGEELDLAGGERQRGAVVEAQWYAEAGVLSVVLPGPAETMQR